MPPSPSPCITITITHRHASPIANRTGCATNGSTTADCASNLVFRSSQTFPRWDTDKKINEEKKKKNTQKVDTQLSVVQGDVAPRACQPALFDFNKNNNNNNKNNNNNNNKNNNNNNNKRQQQKKRKKKQKKNDEKKDTTRVLPLYGGGAP
jgi:hypothetical protein